MTATEERLRRDLYASFKNRALLYLSVFDEMRRELGEARSTELMRRAIYARGREIGAAFAGFGPADVVGLTRAFLDFVPDGGRMFEPEVERCDAQGADIKFHRCPLKEAWREAGVPDEDVAKLCAIAGRVDNGTFEAAGFEFWADTWRPGREGCCHLHVRPGGRAAPQPHT